jgi:hypothetical protein
VYRPESEERLSRHGNDILTDKIELSINPLGYVVHDLKYVLLKNPLALDYKITENQSTHPLVFSLDNDKIANLEAVAVSPDNVGPYLIAVAATKNSGNKLVVIGDSDFITNQMLYYGSNRALILKSVLWTIGESEGIAKLASSVTQSEIINIPFEYLPWFKIILIYALSGLCFVGLFILWRKL